MTLDRAEVSLEKAFEPGMAYVALRWAAIVPGARSSGGMPWRQRRFACFSHVCADSDFGRSSPAAALCLPQPCQVAGRPAHPRQHCASGAASRWVQAVLPRGKVTQQGSANHDESCTCSVQTAHLH